MTNNSATRALLTFISLCISAFIWTVITGLVWSLLFWGSFAEAAPTLNGCITLGWIAVISVNVLNVFGADRK